ncbi:response regulator [Leptospira alstonii]|uniref:response regulator n=1 Tax=Leptospira alstonii TaxID=28452 RepID=UPI000A6A5E68|nr:response regulator [Leptospira alstonii]
MKIMIVDDSTIVRMVIERYLKLTKLEIVAQASNGVQAIELFKVHKPDIVTLDITMPEMDGLAALGEMLKIKPDAKIIMISALTSKTTVVKAVNAGAVSYLIKPLLAHKLTDTLKKILGE